MRLDDLTAEMDLEKAIARHPLVVSPQTSCLEAIALMNQSRSSCLLNRASDSHQDYTLAEASASCVLVVEDHRLLGIFTERDVVRGSVRGETERDPAYGTLRERSIAEMMTVPVITLQQSHFKTIFTALTLFQTHRIRHLPLVDEQGQVVGLVTHESLRQLLRPVDWLRLRMVGEVMTAPVIYAVPETSVLEVACQMAEHHVSSVVIVQPNESSGLIPVGMMTERDIVQFQGLELNLSQLTAAMVMSTPIFTVQAETPVSQAQALMQQHRLSRLVVTQPTGELCGIVTQTSLLQVLNPVEMYQIITSLEEKVHRLEQEKIDLLKVNNRVLEREVQQRTQKLQIQTQQERLLSAIASRIRSSLDLQAILDVSVTEIRDFLNCDRVLVYQFQDQGSGLVVAESVMPGWTAALHNQIDDPCFPRQLAHSLLDDWPKAVANIYEQGYSSCYLQVLEQYQIKANLVVPLLVENQWWGLLIAHQCKDFRSWQSDELELLDRIAVQLAIAIQQAITYQRAQQELAERKRAEIALQRSEAVQRAIIESIPDLLILVDRRGQYQAILSGGAVQEILRPDPQIEQPTVHHVLPQDLADRRMVAIEQAFLTKTIQIYEQPIKLNGQLCWEEVRVTRVGDELALVMVRDITERKQAEATLQQLNQELESAIERRTAALRESEQRFRQIFEQSPVGIAISDLAGKLVRVNSSLAEMMGCTHAQLQQRSIQQLLQTGRQPEEIPQLQQLLEQTLTVISFEKQPVTPDGKTLWVNVTSALLLDGFGHPSGMIHLVNDITERKQAEEQLNWTLKELSDFKYALDQAAIVAITDQNGVISYANERFCEISQYSKSELIGQSHKIVSSSYHPPEFFAQLWKTIAQGQVWRGEIRNRAKDGSHYWVDSTIVPFLDDQGQPLQYLAIRTDITDRKQTEALLRSSEARLRIAQRIANLGSWEIDLQTLTITWSQESFTIFGRDPETGTPSYEEFRAFIHPDDLAYHDEVLTQALAQGQPLETEYRFYWPDRTLRHIQSRGEPIFDEKGNLRKFVGTVLDITQRKEAEEQLRNLSDRLSRAVNSGNMGIWEWDIPQDRLIWDEQMYRLYGTQKRDFHLTYQAWTHGLHLEDRPAAEACIQQALKGEGEFDTEFRVVHPDGSIHFLKASGIVRRNEQGEPQQMVGINFDITDRRLAEENLKRQLSAIEAAIDGIAILKGDIFTYLNPAHLTMFGYQQIEDLMGQPWHSLYSPEERNRLEQEVFPALVEQGFWQGEATAIRQDGTTFTEGISLTLTENGEIICVCRDITLQKQAEQNLRQANTQLILANAELHRVTRLKDEFLANMSHELRTPLNAILGMSEGLQDMVFGPLNDRASRAVQTIEQSGKHLLELINDILDLSKVEAGKLELQTAPVAIRYLCDSSLTFVRQQAIKKNIQLLLSIPPDLPNIVVDERRIRQVLMNLLNNAIKFTPTGGQVELSVQTPGQEGQDFLLFSIRDTGIGIAPEEQHRLFQPFVQIDSSLNREHSGTGLGLALVRRLVELHQGTVSLKSVVGKGSCFTIHLPYHRPQPAPNSRDPISINSPGVIQNHRVLVIEDSQAAAEQVSWYLEELGMHPSIYHQGEGALKQALQLQPGLIFVDVQLPDLSGWQVLTQLKQHPQTQQVPVIVVSVMEERSRGLALGASDYLVKPLSREQLRKTLMQLGYTPGVSRPSALNSPPVSHPRLMAPRLLLAEDNEANVATISSYLKAKGYQIQVATNGREALLKAQEEVPDLILMDIQMPEVDGLTAIAQMRADSSLASIAIIALTALAMPGDREKCLAMGANEYLTKPIRLKHLADVIQNLLDKGQPFISRVDTQASNPEN